MRWFPGYIQPCTMLWPIRPANLKTSDVLSFHPNSIRPKNIRALLHWVHSQPVGHAQNLLHKYMTVNPRWLRAENCTGSRKKQREFQNHHSSSGWYAKACGYQIRGNSLKRWNGCSEKSICSVRVRLTGTTDRQENASCHSWDYNHENAKASLESRSLREIITNSDRDYHHFCGANAWFAEMAKASLKPTSGKRISCLLDHYGKLDGERRQTILGAQCRWWMHTGKTLILRVLKVIT